MARLEENRAVIKEMQKMLENNKTGTYMEMVTLQLTMISTTLADISKSLAILADRAESEEEK